MTQSEFEEIAHIGGTITFEHDPEQDTALKITHSNPWAAAMHQVCVSYNGVVLDFLHCGCIGRVITYPQPSILAFIISDREGLLAVVV